MALVSKTFSQIITFTRASTGTFFNSAGVLTSAAIDAPRFDYNPSTLAAQGLLIEESRTNSIRNNTMVGAVAGTPGTAPTNWATVSLGTLTQQVVGTGTSNGVTYIDIRFSGTTSTTQLSIRFEPNGTGAVAASNGQTWTTSMWTAVVGGSLTNITSRGYSLLYWDSGSSFIGGGGAGIINGTATLSRTSDTVTIAQVGTAFIQPQIYLVFNSGVAIDITLRIGMPQLEQGAFATSVIPTTTTALTRAADVASVNTLSPWFNSVAGTLYSESQLTRQNAIAGLNTFYIWDTGTSEIKMFYRASGATGAAVISSGSIQADLTPTAVIPANTITKLALAYAANDFAASGNGGAAVTDTAGTVPSGLSQVLLGGPSGILNGYLRRISYYPRRLSSAELQAITT